MGEVDAVSHFFACNDHDRVLFISEKGVAFGIRAFLRCPSLAAPPRAFPCHR
jgi:DNA gyrase subunit A